MITHAWKFLFVLLLGSMFPISGCSPASHTPVPAEGTFILYKLDGDTYPSQSVPPGTERMHGWPILQECTIDSLATRQKLFKALDRGIDEYGSAVPVDCFNPRHAIRVETMGVTVDYLICFQCKNYYIYEGDKLASGGLTSSSPKSTFDRVLSDCKAGEGG